jgi:hypothetical protein
MYRASPSFIIVVGGLCLIYFFIVKDAPWNAATVLKAAGSLTLLGAIWWWLERRGEV